MKLRYAVGSALVGYLAGSVSFGRLVGRIAAPGEDVTQTTLELPGGAKLEFEGVSATSIAARKGPGWGMLTGTLDMAKAFVPTWYVKKRWPDEPYAAILAASAIAGHNYPLYHGFNGGRGMAPLYGGLLAIDPKSVPITSVAGIAVGVGGFRDMWMAYTAGMWLTIPWFLWRRRPAEVAYAIAASTLFTYSSRRELSVYREKRKSGELTSLPSLRDFLGTYDRLTGYKGDPEGAGTGSPGLEPQAEGSTE
jgi:glycerol-3-phosphate acyltransferase PlsY